MLKKSYHIFLSYFFIFKFSYHIFWLIYIIFLDFWKYDINMIKKPMGGGQGITTPTLSASRKQNRNYFFLSSLSK